MTSPFAISWLNYNHSDEELFYSTWFSYARNFSFHLALEHDFRMHITWWTVNREREKYFRNRWQGIWRHSHLWFIKWLKCFMHGILKKKKPPTQCTAIDHYHTKQCTWIWIFSSVNALYNVHKSNVCRVQECVR